MLSETTVATATATLTRRVIPCLDVTDGRVVKGIEGVIIGRALYDGRVAPAAALALVGG